MSIECEGERKKRGEPEVRRVGRGCGLLPGGLDRAGGERK